MLDDLANFLPIGERLGTSGQPSEAQLSAIRDQGYEVVVNLGLLGQSYSLADEAKTVGELGLRYEHIPVVFTAPSKDDFARFVAVLESTRNQKVFVHCAMNYRVSCFIALYGEAHLGWTREAADQHIARAWEPDETWRAFLAKVREGFR